MVYQGIKVTKYTRKKREDRVNTTTRQADRAQKGMFWAVFLLHTRCWSLQILGRHERHAFARDLTSWLKITHYQRSFSGVKNAEANT